MFQPSDSGANVPPVSPGNSSQSSPQRDTVRVVVYGSLMGCDRTIKQLHLLGYAEPNDWSAPLPTVKPNQWMRITTKHLLIE